MSKQTIQILLHEKSTQQISLPHTDIDDWSISIKSVAGQFPEGVVLLRSRTFPPLFVHFDQSEPWLALPFDADGNLQSTAPPATATNGQYTMLIAEPVIVLLPHHRIEAGHQLVGGQMPELQSNTQS